MKWLIGLRCASMWTVTDDDERTTDELPWLVLSDRDNALVASFATEAEATDYLAELLDVADDEDLHAIAEDVAVTTTTGDLELATATGALPGDVADPATLGGKPSKATPKDKRLRRNKSTAADGAEDEFETGPEVAPDVDAAVEQMAADAQNAPDTLVPWSGVLAMEGKETGDGREFAPDSLEWDLTNVVPLQWQREHLPEHQASVTVGRIDNIERRPGGVIWGSGVIDTSMPDGADLAQQMRNEMAGGISVDVDSVKESDVELVFPPEDAAEQDDDGFIMLFGPPPDKIVFHRGRIRAATLVAIPAFIEATIHLDQPVDGEPVSAAGQLLQDRTTFGAIRKHETATSDASWDGPANERRLPSPMPVDVANDAYAWLAAGAVEDGMVRKVDGKFIHHEVDGNGNPGAANLIACSNSIGVLNGGRGGSTIPAADRQGVYDHLAKHLRDAGQEPPQLMSTQHLLASGNGVAVGIEAPPLAWFQDPKFDGPQGMTIDGDRLFAHLCLWGSCHTSFADRCVTPPREDDQYPYFHLGELVTASNDVLGIGHITLGTGHAPTNLDAAPAAAHYDHTGHVAADVRVGVDRFGIWVAGAVHNNLNKRSLRALRGAKLSGDWRRIGGKLRLVAILAVNVPGFPVPRTAARLANDELVAMTAAGVLTDERVALVEKVKDEHPGTLRVTKRITTED